MATVDDGASGFFGADHRACDEAWLEVEAAVTAGDQARATAAWTRFSGMMTRHLAMEEEVLFPAFDAATGMHGMGPTAVMRHEHKQMRALLSDMGASAAAGKLQALLDQGDTLLMLIQQHNAKEEGMLYPMADQHLAGEWAEVAAKLKGYLA